MLAAAGLMAGAGLLSSGINYYGAKQNQSDSQDFNLEMWHLNNEYNKPINQMARYKEAGLNPNLIYSQGTPGNSTHPVSTSPSSSPNIDLASSVANYMNFKQIEQNIENQKASEALTKAQTRALNLDTDLNIELKKLQLENNRFNYENTKSNSSNSGVLPYRSSDNFLFRVGGRVINGISDFIHTKANHITGPYSSRLKQIRKSSFGAHYDYVNYLRSKNRRTLPGNFYRG